MAQRPTISLREALGRLRLAELPTRLRLSDVSARLRLSRRRVVVAAAVLVALSVVSGVLTRAPGVEQAVDLTGATAARPATPDQGGAAAPARPEAGQGAAAGPARPEARSGEQASPATVTTIEGAQVSVKRQPLILLNPASVRRGSTIGLAGEGFGPGSTVDLVVKTSEADQGRVITFVQVDRGGGFGNVNFVVPDGYANGSFIVEARQRLSPNVARAIGVMAGLAPQVKLGILVGKPGDEVALAVQGFAPDEEVRIFWNGVSDTPIATLRTGAAGDAQGSIRVPFGAVGNNAFIFVGEKSQSPATLSFLLLNLFPSVQLGTYATRADTPMRFSGKDFGRDERVAVYLNSPDGQPIMMVQANADGVFNETGGFRIPFVLTGKQTLVFIGELSKAPATASFDVLPYAPNVQPSTYGGRPGTTVTFYATDFARSEVVEVYLGRGRDSAGTLVSCFRSDSEGRAAAQGSYVLRGDRPGALVFTFVGRKSSAAATTSVDLTPSEIPAQLPPERPFVCDLGD